MPAPILPGEPKGIGAQQLSSRNATRINLLINGERVGRILTLSRSSNNNMQALRELGAQVLVELKKGISEYRFTVDKMLVRGDVMEELEQGAVFRLETQDEGSTGPNGEKLTQTLDLFEHCAIDTIQRTITAGQATVALSVSIIAIGQPHEGKLAEGQ